jgi:lysophospholipase
MNAAPYYGDVADGPDSGAAHWLSTADELGIRVVHWGLTKAKGTVLMFPGRTEYAEKYGRTAREILAMGYEMVAVDWRGQGLADRMADDRGLGHVGDFADYQHDVGAVLSFARQQGLAEPYYLLAHSMGGCIGLRALHNGLLVKSVAFSAPMWGIEMSPFLRPAAMVMSTIATACGFGTMVSPGQSTENYLGQTTLDDNLLTADPDMFDYMEDQLSAHPDLGLGGPSLQWLNRAFSEMNTLHGMDSPNTPCVTFLGTDEKIVVPGRIMSRMKRWSNGELVTYPKARHEILIEVPQTRDDAYQKIATIFDSNT